jgi:hypothetical protein
VPPVAAPLSALPASPAAKAASAPAAPLPPAIASAPPVASPSADAAANDPAALPQTRDVPAASGAAFEARVAALWNAIVTDDPARAMPFFFPLAAYAQVKDVTDPAADWRHRLVAAYQRDVHALHARLGDGAARARLAGLDVPAGRPRWVEPGEEWNKIGYYRVFGSKLRYEIDGQSHAVDVKSLISWRGEWFVVHLSAIQ